MTGMFAFKHRDNSVEMNMKLQLISKYTIAGEK